MLEGRGRTQYQCGGAGLKTQGKLQKITQKVQVQWQAPRVCSITLAAYVTNILRFIYVYVSVSATCVQRFGEATSGHWMPRSWRDSQCFWGLKLCPLKTSKPLTTEPCLQPLLPNFKDENGVCLF